MKLFILGLLSLCILTANAHRGAACDKENACNACQRTVYELKFEHRSSCENSHCRSTCYKVSQQWNQPGSIFQAFLDDNVGKCDVCFRAGFCSNSQCTQQKIREQEIIETTVDRANFAGLVNSESIDEMVHKILRDEVVNFNHYAKKVKSNVKVALKHKKYLKDKSKLTNTLKGVLTVNDLNVVKEGEALPNVHTHPGKRINKHANVNANKTKAAKAIAKVGVDSCGSTKKEIKNKIQKETKKLSQAHNELKRLTNNFRKVTDPKKKANIVKDIKKVLSKAKNIKAVIKKVKAVAKKKNDTPVIVTQAAEADKAKLDNNIKNLKQLTNKIRKTPGKEERTTLIQQARKLVRDSRKLARRVHQKIPTRPEVKTKKKELKKNIEKIKVLEKKIKKTTDQRKIQAHIKNIQSLVNKTKNLQHAVAHTKVVCHSTKQGRKAAKKVEKVNKLANDLKHAIKHPKPANHTNEHDDLVAKRKRAAKEGLKKAQLKHLDGEKKRKIEAVRVKIHDLNKTHSASEKHKIMKEIKTEIKEIGKIKTTIKNIKSVSNKVVKLKAKQNKKEHDKQVKQAKIVLLKEKKDIKAKSSIIRRVKELLHKIKTPHIKRGLKALLKRVQKKIKKATKIVKKALKIINPNAAAKKDAPKKAEKQVAKNVEQNHDVNPNPPHLKPMSPVDPGTQISSEEDISEERPIQDLPNHPVPPVHHEAPQRKTTHKEAKNSEKHQVSHEVKKLEAKSKIALKLAAQSPVRAKAIAQNIKTLTKQSNQVLSKKLNDVKSTIKRIKTAPNQVVKKTLISKLKKDLAGVKELRKAINIANTNAKKIQQVAEKGHPVQAPQKVNHKLHVSPVPHPPKQKAPAHDNLAKNDGKKVVLKKKIEEVKETIKKVRATKNPHEKTHLLSKLKQQVNQVHALKHTIAKSNNNEHKPQNQAKALAPHPGTALKNAANQADKKEIKKILKLPHKTIAKVKKIIHRENEKAKPHGNNNHVAPHAKEHLNNVASRLVKFVTKNSGKVLGMIAYIQNLKHKLEINQKVGSKASLANSIQSLDGLLEMLNQGKNTLEDAMKIIADFKDHISRY